MRKFYFLNTFLVCLGPFGWLYYFCYIFAIKWSIFFHLVFRWSRDSKFQPMSSNYVSDHESLAFTTRPGGFPRRQLSFKIQNYWNFIKVHWIVYFSELAVGVYQPNHVRPGVIFSNQVLISTTFYAHLCFAKLFSRYSLALLFFGKRILAPKLLVKCWKIDHRCLFQHCTSSFLWKWYTQNLCA